MTDPYLPIRKWDQLIPQSFINLNIIYNYSVNPGLYYFNKYPMAPPGTRVIVHNKPVNRTLWGHHVTWHIVLVNLSITWPLYMYAVIHDHNWHSHNHRYITIYPKVICFPKNNQRRLYPTINWRHNCKYKRPPEETIIFLLWWCNKSCNQSDIPNFENKHSSDLHTIFTVTPNANTESEWKTPTTRNHQHASIRSEGGTFFATSEVANTRFRSHAASKISELYIT